MYEMLCALDMSVHSTRIVYGVECHCRGLHTLVMGLSAVTQIALHWCAVTPHYMGTWVCVHGTDLELRLELKHVGLGMGRSPIEFHSVKGRKRKKEKRRRKGRKRGKGRSVAQ